MDDGLLISRDEHDLNRNRNRYEKRRNEYVTMQCFLVHIVTVDALEKEEGPRELIGDIEPWAFERTMPDFLSFILLDLSVGMSSRGIYAACRTVSSSVGARICSEEIK